MSNVTLEKIVSHCKSMGYVYQGSEIYDGLANTWDFGPLGVELKNNIKKAWWLKFVQASPYNVGLDSAIFLNPKVWETSGHLTTFSDPMLDCKKCKARHRADQLIENASNNQVNPSGWTTEEMMDYIEKNNIACPNCGSHDFTNIRQFNLMFKTFQGVTEENQNVIYLRPETAQGIYINFRNVLRTSRKKLPFGIGQIGKSFRNEITPGNFIFRLREFEQMELQFFCKPGTDQEWYDYWLDFSYSWLKNLGLKEDKLRIREHSAEELSFYSKGTCDIEYLFPFNWGEVWGIANRTNYDLSRHQEATNVSMEYLDPETNEKYIPYCIEPSVGVERLVLSFLCDSYEEEQLEQDTRIVMHLHPYLAPVKLAILPLSKQLSSQAQAIYEDLAESFMCQYDESGNIGRRYRRQDAIGTPFCLTVDFDTETDQSVTIRFRDSMEQVRMPITEVKDYILKQLKF